MKKIISIFLIAVLMLAGLAGCDFFGSKERSDDILPHLISEDEMESNPVRYINSRPSAPIEFKTSTSDVPLARLQLEEMYGLVQEGYKPNVEASHVDTLVRQTYLAAIGILNRYIRNDFTAFERVHAIHDYLAYYIDYDFDLYEEFLSGSIDERNPAFFLDGVFINKKAVCDGLARAFHFLCALEGISAHRVEGFVSSAAGDRLHAWNKVQLDGEWYNVDVTLDNAYASVDGKVIKAMHHGYFLISDVAITSPGIGNHSETNVSDNPLARGDYDYHAQETGIVDGETAYSMEITSASDLKQIFKVASRSNGKLGRFELKLNFEDEDWRNPNSYIGAIEQAYKEVGDKDFVFDRAAGKFPFFRYPNGVFVFLIYK